MLTTAEQQQVDEFIAANDRSPVIAGWVVDPDPAKPAKGGVYELRSGMIFKLNVNEARALPDGYPKWDLD